MYIKSTVELIYQGLTVDEEGNPINVEISKCVKCNEAQTFSVNYYNNQQRNQRTSRNLVIPTYLTEDICIDGLRYELMYCIYDCKKYRVKSVLKMRNTRQQMILDIDEVR